jgi:alpha-glucosidase
MVRAAGLMIIAIFSFGMLEAQRRLEVKSPDRNLVIRLETQGALRYTVTYKDREIITPSGIALQLESVTLGSNSTVSRTSGRKVNETIHVPYGQSSTLSNAYNELTIRFAEGFSVVLRAYNEGVAYRFRTGLPGTIKVIGEEADFNVAGSPQVVFPETSVFTSWEVPFLHYESVNKIPPGKMGLTPTLLAYPDGVKVAIAESDLLDYPGMYVKPNSNYLKGTWAQFPGHTELGSWGNFVSVVKERTDYLAETSGTRDFPWRVIMVTDDDKTLLANKLVYKLATPLKIDETSWIKPGKAAWEWWHDAIVEDAPVPSGMKNRNTALYKHYIDFASAYKIEYMMVDAGWSDNYDLYKVKPYFDVQELVRYGREKKVGLFLWCVMTTLRKDLEGYMKKFEEWGVAGIKVDFIDRDDQEAIRWFEEVAAAAARHKLMVDFHGCSKPTGLERAYPNIVNYEAVRGAECSKWDLTANPDQHLLIPFIRMLAGPLDYTPGSMRNRTQATFKPVDPGLPSAQGTRCHELSMYVLFDQPFAMLCDAPAEYRKYPDIMRFLSAVPTTFDETLPLTGSVGELAVVAKRKGAEWFIGAATNWEARSTTIDFSFLPKGKTFTAEVYTDGKDANTQAGDYTYTTQPVDAATKMKIDLAQGGGSVIYVH